MMSIIISAVSNGLNVSLKPRYEDVFNPGVESKNSQESTLLFQKEIQCARARVRGGVRMCV